MRIQVLGSLGATDDAGDALVLGGPKQRTALVVLCLDPGRPVLTDTLIEAVWGEQVPDRAGRSLATYVSNLRRVVGDVIDFDSGTYMLRVERSQVDACEFVDLVESAEAVDGHERVELLRSALALWSGDPFTGLDGHGAFRDEITRLKSLHLAAAVEVADADLVAGEALDVLARVELLVGEFPYDEGLRGLHMRALYRSGRQADALGSFNAYKNQIGEEFGLDPAPELQDLELQILQQSEDLGGVKPARRTLRRVAGLPMRYSLLVGRSGEIADVQKRLASDRLVTLVGPGGIGKSSIAVAAVADSDLDMGTVAYVSVEPIRDGDVATSIATAVGLESVFATDPVEVLIGYFETRPHMIVLDGCEARIGEVARVVDALLSSSPVSIVATSREPLGLYGETTIRVGPLAMEDSVDMFRDRAGLDVDLDAATETAIVDVCGALDGMPLAVELASARSRSIPTDRLAERMSDQIQTLKKPRGFDERHGSLLAALDWSYDLLGIDEQYTLRELSIFRGDFTMDDAIGLHGDDTIEGSVERLAEVSLLQPPDSHGRFRFLEPVRQYARHQLHASGDQGDVERRHIAWMVQTARDVWTEHISLDPRDAVEWRVLVRRLKDEALEAVKTALTHDDPDSALSIVGGIGAHLANQGIYAPFAQPALEAVMHPAATRDQNYVMAGSRAGSGTLGSGPSPETERGMAILDDCLVIALELDDTLAEGMVRGVLALTRLWKLEVTPSEALEQYEEAMTLLTEAGFPATRHFGGNRAYLIMADHRPVEALEAAQDTAAWFHNAGRIVPPPRVAEYEARISQYSGDWQHAVELWCTAAEQAEKLEMFRWAHECWPGAAHAAYITDDTETMTYAAEQHKTLTAMTGLPTTIVIPMEVASTHGDHNQVLTLATQWFEHCTKDRFEEPLVLSGVPQEDIYGTKGIPPRIFAILWPVVDALLATGKHDAACRIINSITTCMTQSPFQYWNEYQEPQHWAQYNTTCIDQEHKAQLTLEELLPFVQDTIERILTDNQRRA